VLSDTSNDALYRSWSSRLLSPPRLTSSWMSIPNSRPWVLQVESFKVVGSCSYELQLPYVRYFHCIFIFIIWSLFMMLFFIFLYHIGCDGSEGGVCVWWLLDGWVKVGVHWLTARVVKVREGVLTITQRIILSFNYYSRCRK